MVLPVVCLQLMIRRPFSCVYVCAVSKGEFSNLCSFSCPNLHGSCFFVCEDSKTPFVQLSALSGTLDGGSAALGYLSCAVRAAIAYSLFQHLQIMFRSIPAISVLAAQ